MDVDGWPESPELNLGMARAAAAHAELLRNLLLEITPTPEIHEAIKAVGEEALFS